MKRIIFSLAIFMIIIIVGLHKIGVVFFDYNGKDEGEYDCLVLDSYKETDNKKVYKIRINNDKFLLYLNKNEKCDFEVGDYISFYGEYSRPEVQRNTGGFDYSLYLKSKKILGSFNGKNIDKKNKKNYFIYCLGKVKRYLENVYDKNLSEKNSSLIKGLILGENSNIDKEQKDIFRDASLSHVLVISGAHFSYIVLIIDFILKKYKNKRKKEDIKILLILLFINLVGISPSILRAGIMVIYNIISKKVYRQSDFLTGISLSLLIQLINNPYVIFDNGLMFSYLATIGIVLYSTKIKKYFKSTIISTTLAANLFIFPVMIYYFNTISLNFVISNLFTSFLLGPIIICGILAAILPIKPICFVLNILISILSKIAELCSKIPYSKFYVITPSIIFVLLFYSIIILNLNLNLNYNSNYKKHKKMIVILLIVLLISNANYKAMYYKLNDILQINMVDVGQGDCCLIQSSGKSILIDCGGSSGTSNYDVGYNTTLPYLLDKGIYKLNYLMFSHFDADHAEGGLAIINSIKVDNIIIGKNCTSNNLKKNIIKIAKEKKINIIEVSLGDKIKIGKVEFEIISPSNDLIAENAINNNSIVCKMIFNKFSILFTGDIEKEAEEQLLKLNFNFKSDILKVAHHGSISSSTEEFLDIVKPRIALIGVGKDNKFDHPNNIVIKRLENRNCKIYRTDNMGEIMIKVYKTGIVEVKKLIN